MVSAVDSNVIVMLSLLDSNVILMLSAVDSNAKNDNVTSSR